MSARLAALRALLRERQAQCAIVTKPENRRYFSGFSGTAGLLVITADEARLVTDFRYTEQAAAQAPAFEIVRCDGEPLAEAAKCVRASQAHAALLEGDFCTQQQYAYLSEALPGCALQCVELDTLRAVKDAWEIGRVKKAVEISDAAFSHVLRVLRHGMREFEVAAELEYAMRKLGSEHPAFDTIVASGKRSSLPHGLATDKRLEAGDFVTMDFGAVYDGYHSDITRTVVIGRASEAQRALYELVLRAQLAGVAAMRPGVSGKQVDAAARGIIADAGYAHCFGHGLGHGVGLAIHEFPRLSPRSSCGILEKNMLVTVEPGVYLPEEGGVRIEDTVLVTDSGAEVLTQSSKQLLEIAI